MPSAEACLPSSPFRLPCGGQAAGGAGRCSRGSRHSPKRQLHSSPVPVRPQRALVRMGGEATLPPSHPGGQPGQEAASPLPNLCHLPEQEVAGAGEASLIPTFCLTASRPQQSSSMPTTRAKTWPFSGHRDLPLHPGMGTPSSPCGPCPSSLSQGGRGTAAAGCHLRKPCEGCITLNFCQ